jgi:hypothetical protein
MAFHALRVLAGLFVGAMFAVHPRLAQGRSARPWLVATAAVVAAGIAFDAAIVIRSIAEPPPYDFLSFFLYGHVAVAFGNVYDPAHYHALQPADPHGVLATIGFVRESLDAGLLYPPFTIPLFAGLGLIGNFHAAAAVWYALLVAALGYAACQIATAAFGSRHAAAVLCATGAVALFPPTGIDLIYAQTVPFALIGLNALLAGLAGTGLWLGLAIVAKPFCGVLLLVELGAKRFRTVAWSATILVLATLAGVAIAGPIAALGYVRGDAERRIPGYLYMEDNNASLSGMVLRAKYHGHPPLAVHLAQEPLVLI